MSSYQELISQREKLDQQIETAKAAEFDAVVKILKKKCRSMELHAPILAFSLAKAISYVLACALNPNITIRRIRKKNGRAAERAQMDCWQEPHALPYSEVNGSERGADWPDRAVAEARSSRDLEVWTGSPFK